MKHLLPLLLLTLCLTISLLPMNVRAEERTDVGTCGENLTWSFDESTGVLIITGTGDMYDYTSQNKSPFYGKEIKTVIIENGVTSIGDYCFWYCGSLTNVSMPEGLVKIGQVAFAHCNNISEISIPASVTNIGSSAFYNCSSLTHIALSGKITSISSSLFENCTSIVDIIIPECATSIGISAFENCSSLTSIVIPNSVTTIGDDAFYGCKSLVDVSIPDSVTKIGKRAFSGCSASLFITCNCGNEYIRTYAMHNVIDSTEHDIVIDPEIPATETTSGLTEGKHCSICNTVLIAQEIVPAIVQYNGHYYVVDSRAASSFDSAITLIPGNNYYKAYSSSPDSKQWYSKFTLKTNNCACIGFTSNQYYKFCIYNEDGLKVYDFGSKAKYDGCLPLEAGTYYILLEAPFASHVVLSYSTMEYDFCELEPNDTFSDATMLELGKEYQIFLGEPYNKDYLAFDTTDCSKIRIEIEYYEDVNPTMYLYESDRATLTIMQPKYDSNGNIYYYEFTPKYEGEYFIMAQSSLSYSDYPGYNITIIPTYSETEQTYPTAPEEPKPTEPKPTEPKPTEPQSTQPRPTEPPVTESGVTVPSATEPVTTNPAVTEPVVTTPVMTGPAATETQPDPTAVPTVPAEPPAGAQEGNVFLIILPVAAVATIVVALVVLKKRPKT